MSVKLLHFPYEKDWLAQREKDVTSTEVAALFGLHPHKSRWRLWMEKAGRLESDFEASDYTEWGRELQLPVAMKICRDNGWTGKDLTGFYYHDEELRGGASMDVLALCEERGRGILEVKIAEAFSKENGWTDTMTPLDKEFQIQDQMHLAAKAGEPFDWGVIGTLGKRQSTRLYFRTYDAKLGQRIDDELGSFWRSIQEDRPPEPDYAVDAADLYSLAPAVREGEGCNLSGDEKAVALMTQWDIIDKELKPLREKIKPLEKQKKKIEAEVHAIMGDREKATIAGFTVRAPDEVREERFVSASESRRFYVSKTKRR